MYPLNTRGNVAIKRLFFFSCLLVAVTTNAQQPSAFEKKLQDFRYSFFAVFDQKDSTGTLRSRVLDKIQHFVTENEADIKTYRKQHLEKNLENQFSFAAYNIDAESELPKEVAFGMKGYPGDDYTDAEMNTLLEYALMTPDVLLGGIVSSDYMMRTQKKEMTIKEISIRVAIASPKERVIKLDDTRYQIIFDYYTVVYSAEYSVTENSLRGIKVWERKR